MLHTRVLTAIVVIPVVAGLIYLGGLPLFLSLGILLSVAAIEFSRLAGRRGFRAVHLAGVGVVWLCLADAQFPGGNLLALGLGGVLLLSLSWQTWHYPRSPIREWTGTMAGGLYIGVCGACLVRLRAMPGDGLWWTAMTVCVILAADLVAYAVGSLLGRMKLAPRLSPGKTVEGYLTGIASGILVGALMGWLWASQARAGSTVTWLNGLGLGFVVSAVAPVGDLVVSMMKRDAGVKDSGSLFPGHGGALDRVDSVLFAAVIGHAYLAWVLPWLGR